MIRTCSEGRIGFKILRIIGMVITGILFAIVIGFLFGYLIQLLWNWLMPQLFGFGTITYWQGFGLFLLGKLLFGGFGHHYYKKKHLGPFGYKCYGKWHRDKYKKFHRYWEEEGEAAFEDYLKRDEADKTDK
jgi:hypothetical protein